MRCTLCGTDIADASAIHEVVIFRTAAGVNVVEEPTGRIWCSQDHCIADTQTEREIRRARQGGN
jgi:hypothetical protein